MKLTVAIKDLVVSRVLEETLGARYREIDLSKEKLAMDIWKSQGTAMCKLLRGLPDGVVRKANTIPCYLGGRYLTFTAAEPLPHARKAYDQRLRFAEDHPLTKRFLVIDDIEIQISKDRGELKKQIQALLDSCTTDKKLLTVWPEAVNYLPAAVTEANLPAVVTEDINKMILAMKAA